MRRGKHRKFGREAGQRKGLYRALATALIEHGKIKIGGNNGGNLNNNVAGKEYNGLDEFRCPNNGTPCSDISIFVEKKVQVEKQDVVIIVAGKWNQLNLLQQFTYFKEKITEMQTKIKKDLNQLDEARNTIQTPAVLMIARIGARIQARRCSIVIEIAKYASRMIPTA